MRPKEKKTDVQQQEPTTVIYCRDVPVAVWRAVRAEAERTGKNTGEMLGILLRQVPQLKI